MGDSEELDEVLSLVTPRRGSTKSRFHPKAAYIAPGRYALAQILGLVPDSPLRCVGVAAPGEEHKLRVEGGCEVRLFRIQLLTR